MDGISGQFRSFANPAALMEQFKENAQGVQGKIPADQIARVADSVGVPSNVRMGDGSDSFSSIFGNLVGEVNAKQVAATRASEASLAGENVPLHQTMLAVEEASVAFQLMVEVRNKLLESYQELMRMQV